MPARWNGPVTSQSEHDDPNVSNHGRPRVTTLPVQLLAGHVGEWTEHWTGRHQAWVLVLCLPFSSCGALIKSLNLSELQAPPCDVIHTLFKDTILGSNEITHVKVTYQYRDHYYS